MTGHCFTLAPLSFIPKVIELIIGLGLVLNLISSPIIVEVIKLVKEVKEAQKAIY